MQALLFWFPPVDSMGRRNTGVKSISGGFIVQRFSRTLTIKLSGRLLAVRWSTLTGAQYIIVVSIQGNP